MRPAPTKIANPARRGRRETTTLTPGPHRPSSSSSSSPLFRYHHPTSGDPGLGVHARALSPAFLLLERGLELPAVSGFFFFFFFGLLGVLKKSRRP